MAKTTVDTLAADVMKILNDYAIDVANMTKTEVRKVGKKGVQALKSNSSIFGGTGKYASGWDVTVEGTKYTASATLHNARVPGLPHLLEHGHALRQGGRTAARVHIAPVERELENTLIKELEARL